MQRLQRLHQQPLLQHERMELGSPARLPGARHHTVGPVGRLARLQGGVHGARPVPPCSALLPGVLPAGQGRGPEVTLAVGFAAHMQCSSHEVSLAEQAGCSVRRR